MEKINIADLLKGCPKGMELDCINYNGVVTFEEIFNCPNYPIKISIKYNNEYFTHTLTKYGQTCKSPYNKCIIFPKGKTTWEGFQRPFVEGDIVSTEHGIYIGIVKSTEDSHLCYTFCSINDKGDFFIDDDFLFSRLATEEEKQKLFQAIKDNGYKWNPETKTLEKLVEPKFKVGDKIKSKENHNYIYTITGIREKENKYECGVTFVLRFSEQDNWELVPNKFDITTLKPFDSKVLIRNDESQYWIPSFWGYKRKDGYTTTFGWCKYCIPYEGNEHLLETNDDCDEHFKTWK